MRDTIFALSSGQAPSAIGIIRISGPNASQALLALIDTLPDPRRAKLGRIVDPASGQLLDKVLILWFPGPATATGEDLVELHCHGGRAVIAAVQGALGRLDGLRAAEPGEFTRRAFENGRMDLNEVEGLSDLLLAETETQRRAAMAMADGHFSRRLMRWQNALLHVSAQVEAALDFSDEDDVPDAHIEKQIAEGVASLVSEISIEQARPSAERLRDGIRVVIAGPPNAGKSTLLNALVGRDAAIVSDTAGTTRDRIEIAVALKGVAFVMTDTAGLHDATNDPIERLGISRAQDAIQAADILLWLGDPIEAPAREAIRIAAQSDLAGHVTPEGADLSVSALTGAGMTDLVELLVDKSAQLLPGEGDYALHARQRAGLEHIAQALTSTTREHDLLIIAELLRRARTSMDALTGRSGTEDMLDALFGGFCIGK